MPHMAPIMWAAIMIMTFSLMIILMSMIYFNSNPLTPESEKVLKESLDNKWMW
uniref:ATP synthase F0 subunit 8 n=1 Tax=Notochthamalus scabrosus TaxID=261896 RepID=U5LTX3_NOTSA|nr:ATP synthase F0 subunit 8 [Notochthamalus scabrosus]AGX31629.1 ATP synthase F0 subunit 8 [Notochthamalus scabrosus]